MQYTVWVDLEAGGLFPDVHALTEVAMVVLDAKGNELFTLEAKVRPAPGMEVSEWTRQNTGFSDKVWEKEGVDEAELLPMLAFLCDGKHVTIAGQNTRFDWSFLVAAWERCGVPVPTPNHHLLDTSAVAQPLKAKGWVSSVSLASLCDYFGVSNAGAHTAMADVRRTIAVYHGLVEHFTVLGSIKWALSRLFARMVG